MPLENCTLQIRARDVHRVDAMGKHAMELRSRIDHAERSVVHHNDPQGARCGAVNQMRQIARRSKAADLSEEDSFRFFQNENPALLPNRTLQIDVHSEVQEIAQKPIQFGRSQNPLLKFRTNKMMARKDISRRAVQQARLPAAASADQQARSKPSCLPIADRLVKSCQFLIAPDQKTTVFDWR